MNAELYIYQQDALQRMHNGCILCGGVGSGKSITALAYYIQKESDLPLYIITTARKRDSKEWKAELDTAGLSDISVVIDSWNNIGKYKDVKNVFFIFDEQRVVGRGAWVNSFLKIVRSNRWVLLSATPGDKWEDYIPVFIANGFYKNRSEFSSEHLVYSPYSKFPKVLRYTGTGKLNRYRRSILVDMDFNRQTLRHHIDCWCEYNTLKYKDLMRNRYNYEEDRPIENASEFCYALRKMVNTDASRVAEVIKIVKNKKRCIIFYNFDYELEILRNLDFGDGFAVAEWNGHNHQFVPDCDKWVYLVQYTAGAEGWNCITSDTVIFFSQNYSYKIMEQAAGRIDRVNTPYYDLYFYHLKSRSGIDIAINRALNAKKDFNVSAFAKGV